MVCRRLPILHRRLRRSCLILLQVETRFYVELFVYGIGITIVTLDDSISKYFLTYQFLLQLGLIVPVQKEFAILL